MTTQEWTALGTGMAMAFIAFMQVLQNWKIKEVHVLVNSQYGDSLLTGMVSAKALANLTNSEADIKLAEVAAKKYAEHQAKQSIVDAGKK